jgi:hypothetical protein
MFRRRIGGVVVVVVVVVLLLLLLKMALESVLKKTLFTQEKNFASR